MRNPSIRLRLTLWNAAALMLILGVVSLGIYTSVRGRLEALVQGRLDAAFDVVDTVLRRSQGDICDVAHLSDESIFRISRGGETLYQTRSWRELFADRPADVDGLFKEGSWRSAEGLVYKLKAGSIPEYGFDLVVAHDFTVFEEGINNLTFILLAGFPFALALSLIGGYVLAGRALAPVKSIIEKAREINAERLSERLPVSNPHDEIGRLASVINDTLSRLQEAFERLRRFTADASHELRTPLTSIRSVGEVALQGKPGLDDCREAISSMLEEANGMSRLVDNLLTLARGDAGGVAPDRANVDLAGLLRRVIDELHILAEEKNQVLAFEEKSPASAFVDASLLRLAVTNVLHNAVKYGRAGGRIAVELSVTDGGAAVIDIADDGPGIPEDEREKVFERFYRLDKARSRAEGGAGLGLAIARWAVEVNGGKIEFCDKEGPGSCCRIALPLRGRV